MIASRAREHHEQQLARTAPDDATFERECPDSARVHGEVVELHQGERAVARYRWALRPRPGNDSNPMHELAFEAL